jgi:peptidoglycan/xylan/chitin deacetylase (PgdA/CDA1 family)
MRLERDLSRLALRSLSASGLPALMARFYAGQGGILSFHRIHTPTEDEFGSLNLSVSPQNFRYVVEALTRRGYRFLTMSALVERLRTGNFCDGKVVCLTFDDGFMDTYTNAFAICREFGVPMTIYLVSSFIRNEFPAWSFALERIIAAQSTIDLPWGVSIETGTRPQKHLAYRAIASRLVLAPPDEVAQACDALGRRYGVDFLAIGHRHMLTLGMIREMQRTGLVEFGAHSVHHAYLSRLDYGAAWREIAQSKQHCEALLGHEIHHFAYPYGDSSAFGEREIAICRRLGFDSAVTTECDTIRLCDQARMLSLPRLTYSGQFQDTPLLDLLLSGTLPVLRRNLAGLRHLPSKGRSRSGRPELRCP